MQTEAVSAVIVGDIMLDTYECGTVTRISPEAPVPIFNTREKKHVLGGAGNVAANLSALGCEVRLLGIIGRDAAGESIKGLLLKHRVSCQRLLTVRRPTTVKTRFVSGFNQLLRVDTEDSRPIEATTESRLVRNIRAAVRRSRILVLSDYNKGVLTPSLCREAIREARRCGVPVLVDPKGLNYEKYRDATLVKPNLKELCEAAKTTIDLTSENWKDEVSSCAKSLAAQFGFKGVLTTLSERGMMYSPADTGESSILIPTEAKSVFDVSGAGDTVLAALAHSLASGMSIPDAMHVANVASGIAVSKVGTAVVTRAELDEALLHVQPAPPKKILSLAALAKEIREIRKKRPSVRIGFTNGCFDCCHLGHLSSLREARSLCDILVVGVNSDKWIRRHKGPCRPIQDEATRSELLAALTCVDYVTVFSNETALAVVKAIRPDVIAKEGYALDQWLEGRLVIEQGGKAVTLKRIEGYSTTNLVSKAMGSKT